MSGTDSGGADRDEWRAQRAIDRLLSRFMLGCDERQFTEAWAVSMFTEDFVLEFPVGVHEGLEGVPAYLNGIFSRWGPTQHVSTNHLIEVEGDSASIRANVIAVHLHQGQSTAGGSYFESRGFYEGKARRVTAGWRLRRLGLHIVWTAGSRPG
jgi:hypothetical protein